MVEICVRVWFVDKGEVPPFVHDRLEAVANHGLAENHSVAELRFVDFAVGGLCVAMKLASVFACFGVAAPVWMTLLSEPVKSAAHVNIRFLCHVEECQIDGAAAAVPRLFGDVALREKERFVEIRIEILFHAGVGGVLRPVHKVDDGAFGAVCVIDLQAVAMYFDVIADGLQGLGGLDGEECGGLFIAVYAVADEIVSRVVANLQNRVRNHLGEMYETRRSRIRSCCHAR